MILVMDVGNTNIVIGVYEGKNLVYHWRISTDKDKTSDEFGMFIVSSFGHEGIDIEAIEAIIIASVVPPIMYSLEHAIRKYLKKDPIIVDDKINTGIKILYDNPKEVGADRIVNAVAAYNTYGGPIIIIDFGTATTFCAVSSKGEYLGGAISPGIRIAAEALFMKTAKLPKIDISKPNSIIGKNTVISMQAGIVYGYVGQVDYIVSKMKQEMNEEGIRVVATGGFARLVAKDSSVIDEINAFLTLEGLRIIYEINSL